MALSGGAKLLSRLKRWIGTAESNPVLRVGFLEGKKYPDGTPVASVAAIQEFGAPRVGIPPRPFFRTMVKANKGQWPAQTAKLFKHNNENAKLTLVQMGHLIEGQLRQSIVDMNAPALSPVTLMIRKMKMKNPALRQSMSYGVVAEARRRVAAGESASGASVKPLVDTGELLQSISSEVTTR